MTKFAVLVGCSYADKGGINPVMGAHNDVEMMRDVITARLGFDARNVKVLTDELNSANAAGAKIKGALYKMAKNAKAGDVLFFYFAGHGGINYIKEGLRFIREEYIVAADCNLIYSHDFRDVVSHVPRGATFTILSDSCHSGGLIFLEKEQIVSGNAPRPNKNQIGNIRPISLPSVMRYLKSKLPSGMESSDIGTYMKKIFKDDASLKFKVAKAKAQAQQHKVDGDGGILLSACKPSETTSDVMAGGIYGAFTNAVVECLTINSRATPITNAELVKTVRNKLKGKNQHPCLYCADKYVDAVFLGAIELKKSG